MHHFKIIALYSCLFFMNLGFAQDFKEIPDSLKKYSYDELENIILEKEKLGKNTRIYSKVFLLKAKREANTNKIMVGLVFMSSEFDDLEINLKYSDSAIALAKKVSPKNLSSMYFQKGNVYYHYKRLKEALNCYVTANQYPHKSDEQANTINFYIGAIKSTQDQYEEAITIFKGCEENARINNLSDYHLYLLALSENYNRINQLNLSSKYIKKGIAFCTENKNFKIYLKYFISNRGKNYYKLHQYDKAIEDLTSQLKYIQDNNDFSNYAENSFFIGECYREQNQDEKAVVYYKKVDSIFNDKKDIYPIIMPAYEHLINYYKKKGDYKKVIYYSDQCIKADKIIDDNYKYITTTISKKYDIQKIVAGKQAVISSLSNDKKTAITVTILLLLLLIVLGLLYYKNNKRKQKELLEQKLLFEAYKEKQAKIKNEKEIEKQEVIEKAKKLKASDLDEKIVTYILNCFEVFEKDKLFLNKDCTLQSLAGLWNTNHSYLSRVLNDIKNVSFTQYINSLRIEYIIKKLETEKFFLDYSIQTLSDSSGFNNTQTFARAFKDYTNMNPSDFINHLKNITLKK
jgi:AraC-like DNA-binding protein/tetratricopeptide (TPR) repeat protein